MAVLAYGALCRGLLAGRMTPATRFAGDDLRLKDPKFQPPRFRQYLRAVERLDRFAQENYRKRVIHLAVRWVLDQSASNVALWGARRPDQLAPIEQVMGWRIDAAGLNAIDAILSEAIRIQSARNSCHHLTRSQPDPTVSPRRSPSALLPLHAAKRRKSRTISLCFCA